MILRPYQRDLIDQARERMRRLPPRGRRLILQAATGSGKTAIACDLVRRSSELARQVLYTVPRVEILGQTSRKLTDCGLPHVVLDAGASHDVGAARVVLAMSHTLDRRLARWGGWQPDLIVVDEAHTNTDQAARLAAAWPSAALLGLTATPDRMADGKLAEVYAEILQGPQISELQRQGWLVPCRVLTASQADLSGVRTRAGEFEAASLGLAFQRGDLLGDTVAAWTQHSRGRRTLAFASTVDHSEALVERFRTAGVRAVHVDATTPDAHRQAALDRLRRRDVDVICNVGLFVEGLDLVEVETIQLATATRSLARYLQMVGRGLRPSPATAKSDLLVIDHGANVERHGRPDQDRIWTLREWTPANGVGGGDPPTRACGGCGFRMAIRALVCPACGWRVPPPVERPARLVEVSAAQRRMIDPAIRSRRTAPRPCPPEFAAVAEIWRAAEVARQASGLPLPTGRAVGYSERLCQWHLTVRGLR